MAPEEWRERLRLAVERSGRKHAAIARDAGIAPETLSRIINGTHEKPSFQTVVGLAMAMGVRVAWLVGEPVGGFELTREEETMLRSVLATIARVNAVLEARRNRT